MPITTFINHAANLRVHRATHRVTASEFKRMFRFYTANPRLGETDLITFVDEAIDLAITVQDLEDLRAAFRDMQLSLDPLLILRSVWVCPNAGAWRLLEHWLKDRHSRDGLSFEPYLVACLDDAVCAFDDAELSVVRDWTGFEKLAQFDDDAGSS